MNKDKEGEGDCERSEQAKGKDRARKDPSRTVSCWGGMVASEMHSGSVPEGEAEAARRAEWRESGAGKEEERGGRRQRRDSGGTAAALGPHALERRAAGRVSPTRMRSSKH